jgi:hypothetical protein
LPQAQLDYNLQISLFGDLPFRKELREQGIDFIAHYISQTVSNTAGIHGTGTAYADQVDFGLSFDLDKLGIWSDAIARYAMTERASVNLSNRTGCYVPYQSIYGQGENVRFNEITVEKFLDEKQVALKKRSASIRWATILPYCLISATSPTTSSVAIRLRSLTTAVGPTGRPADGPAASNTT